MESILVHAQALVYTLLGLMPTAYQRDSLQALLGLFLEAQGHPLPEHSAIKSAAALSRFLNHYDWSTRGVIRSVRQQIVQELLGACRRGRRPWLRVIVDLTSLEKCGKFIAFAPLISVLQGKRGLHLVSYIWSWASFEFLGDFEFGEAKGHRVRLNWRCA
ncbi:hypothetical protein [Leptolyngbya ohadii]|uniref:hypothetical protein n=1 Tax=Leptolyngbya ohadii TaxID=1962290 RepID=UPI000B5A0A59|nr:hypothetical protein [Leptolyngbya ohadii]